MEGTEPLPSHTFSTVGESLLSSVGEGVFNTVLEMMRASGAESPSMLVEDVLALITAKNLYYGDDFDIDGARGQAVCVVYGFSGGSTIGTTFDLPATMREVAIAILEWIDRTEVELAGAADPGVYS